MQVHETNLLKTHVLNDGTWYGVEEFRLGMLSYLVGKYKIFTYTFNI